MILSNAHVFFMTVVGAEAEPITPATPSPPRRRHPLPLLRAVAARALARGHSATPAALRALTRAPRRCCPSRATPATSPQRCASWTLSRVPSSAALHP